MFPSLEHLGVGGDLDRARGEQVPEHVVVSRAILQVDGT